jgi:hypothetical protein
MELEFTLINRFDVETIIEEPVGWDAFNIQLKRHPVRHGTFRELQGNSFSFFGAGAQMLRTEYELYGIRSNYRMRIREKCGGGWNVVYFGKVGFDNYKFTCDNGCSVSVDLEQLGAVAQFINRFDQKVDLSSNVALDGAALTDYANLTKSILLPSKAIKLRGSAKNTASQEYIISSDIGFINGFPTGTGTVQGGINIPFATVDVNAIKDFDPQGIMDFYNWTQGHEYIPELVYNNPDIPLNCLGTTFLVEYRVKGRYKNLAAGSGSHAMTLDLKQGTGNFMGSSTLITGTLVANGLNFVRTEEFDVTWTGTVTLAPTERLWLDFLLGYTKNTNYVADVRLEIDPETYFKAEVVSKCDPTSAKFYLINEATSRVIESITNNQLKLYSEYYGRIDSAPYAFPGNGCGSMKAITIGLELRKAKLTDGSDPHQYVSMQEIFESLSAIENIGIGLEGDTIRMENWKFFYGDNVIFECRGIDHLDKTLIAAEHFSIFKNGYDKWEAEDFNGLDEFLTKREFRTALSEIQNTMEKICKWIASGYAFEVTRRKQNDTKDWRYDNDTFILCLTNKFKTLAAFGVDHLIVIPINTNNYQVGDQINVTTTSGTNQGIFTITAVSHPTATTTNISTAEATTLNIVDFISIQNLTHQTYDTEINNINSASNILDPATVYNFRISPMRNALKWFDRIAVCYRNITGADKLIFSAGDGNYIASGELADDTGCKLETTLGSLGENQDISTTAYEDPADGLPINFPERVKYTFPVSSAEFAQINSNPLGLIFYQCKSEKGFGWIDELVWSPEEGKAKFTLIPKIPS